VVLVVDVVGVAMVLVVDVVGVTVVLVVDVVGVAVEQLAGADASFPRKVTESVPSFTSVPPNSVQYDSVLSMVTTVTGDMVPLMSLATCAPLHTAFASTPPLTRTSLHVAPVGSLYL
jgi:hypothetical protein